MRNETLVANISAVSQHAYKLKGCGSPFSGSQWFYLAGLHKKDGWTMGLSAGIWDSLHLAVLGGRNLLHSLAFL